MFNAQAPGTVGQRRPPYKLVPIKEEQWNEVGCWVDSAWTAHDVGCFHEPTEAAPLILVLGHESCGAVDAAIKSLKDNTTLPGQLPSLVAGVGPAVKAVLQQGGDTLGSATRQNVIDTVSKLSTAAPILSTAVEQKKLKVVGGIYRLKDGSVDMVA